MDTYSVDYLKYCFAYYIQSRGISSKHPPGKKHTWAESFEKKFGENYHAYVSGVINGASKEDEGGQESIRL